jgi:threonine dehydrogenase-like Zn-dependent dehydrogenase
VKAVALHGNRDVSVDDVPDATIRRANDAIVRITTTAICGSDLSRGTCRTALNRTRFDEVCSVE